MTPDSSAPDLPLLVILSGPPGTGKTTLAQGLAPALGLFLLAKDDIKEKLGDRLPAASLAESRALGAATFHLLFHLARQLIRAHVSFLLEGAFYRGVSEEELLPMIGETRAVLIHCYATQEVAVRRSRERVERGERHRVHFDTEQPFVAGGIPDETWDRLAKPLELGIPTLTLDTTVDYVTELEPILAFVRSETETR